jgi:hypothetical protein
MITTKPMAKNIRTRRGTLVGEATGACMTSP